MKSIHEKLLEKQENEHHNQRREINAYLRERDQAAHEPEHRVCYRVKKPNYGIVRIGTHPRYEGRDDDNPHINLKNDTDNSGECINKEANCKHQLPPVVCSGRFPIPARSDAVSRTPELRVLSPADATHELYQKAISMEMLRK